MTTSRPVVDGVESGRVNDGKPVDRKAHAWCTERDASNGITKTAIDDFIGLIVNRLISRRHFVSCNENLCVTLFSEE